MEQLELLIKNPELAKHIRFEITGADLLQLAGILVKAAIEKATNSPAKEIFLTGEETRKMVKRGKTTMCRWHKNGTLRHNEIGLYRRSDVERLQVK